MLGDHSGTLLAKLSAEGHTRNGFPALYRMFANNEAFLEDALGKHLL